MKFSMLPQPVGLLKLMLKFYFAQAIFKGENSADVILWNIGLTSSSVRTLVSRFVSNLLWCYKLLNYTLLLQFEWPWCSPKVTGLQEILNFCSHCVVYRGADFPFFPLFLADPFFHCIFLFLNFLSLFVFIFCETAHTHRFSVIFA